VIEFLANCATESRPHSGERRFSGIGILGIQRTVFDLCRPAPRGARLGSPAERLLHISFHQSKTAFQEIQVENVAPSALMAYSLIGAFVCGCILSGSSY
jgi:hypothetical protein